MKAELETIITALNRLCDTAMAQAKAADGDDAVSFEEVAQAIEEAILTLHGAVNDLPDEA